MSLNWPIELGERTLDGKRQRTAKFSVGYSATKSQLSDVLDGRMDVDMWGLDDDKSRSGDPGVVVRWKVDGTDFAIACDRYTSKRDNLRECLLWLTETQRRADRPVVHGGSHFAAAALPPGNPDREKVVARQPPHDVLGVQPGADPDVVKASARRLSRKYHPDSGEEPDQERFKHVREAKKEMLS